MQNEIKIFPISSTQEGRINLFCLPSAGSSAALYAPWIKEYSPLVNILPIEYAGHGSRIQEELMFNIQYITKEICDHILSFDQKDIGLFGHSIGVAIIWYLLQEMHLRKQENRIKIIAFSGRPEKSFVPYEKDIFLLDDQQFIKKISRYSGLPKEVTDNKDILDFFIPILKNDFHLNQLIHDHPVFPINHPIITFGGIDDVDLTPDNMNAWKKYTSQWLGYYSYPGHHFYLKDRDNYADIIRQINFSLQNLYESI